MYRFIVTFYVSVFGMTSTPHTQYTWPQTGLFVSYIRRGADKSLAWNKLHRPNWGFIQQTPHEAQYNSYPVALTFASHSTNFQKVVRPTRSQQWPLRRKKNAELSIVVQSMEQVVVRRGQIRRIRWMIKTLEAQVGQFLLGCKVPSELGHCRARTRPSWWPSPRKSRNTLPTQHFA